MSFLVLSFYQRIFDQSGGFIITTSLSATISSSPGRTTVQLQIAEKVIMLSQTSKTKLSWSFIEASFFI
jgi:hypothetical protein